MTTTNTYSTLTSGPGEIATTLYCLYHTAPFKNAILSCTPDPSHTVVIELQKLFNNMKSGTPVSFKPLLDAMGEIGEPGPCEFFNRLYDSLSKQQISFSSITGKKERSIVCQHCNNVFTRIDNFNVVDFWVRDEKLSTLQKCYDHFSRVEDLNGDNQYQCTSAVCQRQYRDAKCQMKVVEVPDILVFEMQRIGFNSQTYRMDKKHHSVTFPLDTLDVAKMLDPAATNEDIFELYAVSSQGTTDNQTFVKEWPKFEGDESAGWYLYVGSEVQQLRPAWIQTSMCMRAFGGNPMWPTAEMIFYRRKKAVEQQYSEKPKAAETAAQ